MSKLLIYCSLAMGHQTHVLVGWRGVDCWCYRLGRVIHPHKPVHANDKRCLRRLPHILGIPQATVLLGIHIDKENGLVPGLWKTREGKFCNHQGLAGSFIEVSIERL